jgi:glycosyltransferase involved in cell wall biosynthesis
VAADEPRYSIVVPVYRNEATLATLVQRLRDFAVDVGTPVEVVFVVDGSPDGSLALLRRLLAEEDSFSSQLISLSRNFGSFSAIRTGLAVAEGDYVAVMAADLQEPISLVRDFFQALETGDYDIAVGTRASRSDPAAGARAASLFWWLYRHLVQREIPPGGVDVFACTREVAGRLVRLEESHTSLVGLLYWLGFRRVDVPYVRLPRPEGKSAWSFRRKVRYLLDSIYSFTDLPITLIIALGVLGVVVSTVSALVVFTAWAAGKIDVAGYTPLILAVFFMTSLILIALGIVGSYVWRSYENSKGRPDAVPMTHERFGGGGS